MIVAIDIGGTKTLITSFDAGGQVNHEVRFETDYDSDIFLNHLDTELAFLNPGNTEAIALAAPGMVDSQKGIILYSPNLKWKNIALKAHLAKRFHCPIYIGNDANFAGLGAVHSLDTVPDLALYITIGTGIGTGLIVKGDIHPALTHTEGGHMLFETIDGLQEWENFASGRAITKRYHRLATDITDQETWKQIAQALSIGFRTLIPSLQPDIIIIGGGVGSQFDRFVPFVEQQLKAELPSFIAVPPFMQAIDPEKAVIHGCHYYALTHKKDL